MNREQVTVKNAGIAHAHTFHSEQIVRLGAKQLRVQADLFFDVFLSENRAAGSYLAHQWQGI